MQVISKFDPIYLPCNELLHPFNKNCVMNSIDNHVYLMFSSLKLYVILYCIAFLFKRRIPSVKDVKRLGINILRSSLFLTIGGAGVVLYSCLFRNLLGCYNILTVTAIPSFISALIAIQFERKSRRTLLGLYAVNRATETIWNMLENRSIIKSISSGPTIIFSVSLTIILMFYKNGFHKNKDGRLADGMFDIIRYVVGPYEEYGYQNTTEIIEQKVAPNRQNKFVLVVYYKMLLQKIKSFKRHLICPHPHSCIYYTIQGAIKMFAVGLGVKTALVLFLNISKIVQHPDSIKRLFFNRNLFNIAKFLAGFTGIFRGVLCILRWKTGNDNQYNALVAGLLAGTMYRHYNNNSRALDVMFKMLQISYNFGVESGYFPQISGFIELLVCLCTSILFHAAMFEPNTLQDHYWRFLHSITGGRIAAANRTAVDVWGLNTVKKFTQTLTKTRTDAVVKYLF